MAARSVVYRGVNVRESIIPSLSIRKSIPTVKSAAPALDATLPRQSDLGLNCESLDPLPPFRLRT